LYFIVFYVVVDTPKLLSLPYLRSALHKVANDSPLQSLLNPQLLRQFQLSFVFHLLSFFQYPKMKFAAAIIATLAGVLPVLGTNITVIVGADANGTAALVFNPQVITANVGDLINFEFHGGNHTVTQSSFPSMSTQMYML
jgi:hypothetical protein